MLLALLLDASAADMGPSPIATWRDAVTRDTAALSAALPRLALCDHPAADKLVVQVALGSAPNVTVAALRGSATTRLDLPCVAKGVGDVFGKAPHVGKEAVFVLDPVGADLKLEGDVALLGALTHDQIEATMRTRLDNVIQCYVAALPSFPGLEGDVTVAFTVLPDGTTTGMGVKRSTLVNRLVETCVLGALEKIQFPAPDGGGMVHVSYPFTFKPTDLPPGAAPQAPAAPDTTPPPPPK